MTVSEACKQKISSMLGMKFGHYNASYNALQEKYGPVEKRTERIREDCYNNIAKHKEISEFFNGGKKIAVATTVYEYDGLVYNKNTEGYTYRAFYDDDYYDVAVKSTESTEIKDCTTGYTYHSSYNKKFDVITFEYEGEVFDIYDNGNGYIDEGDTIRTAVGSIKIENLLNPIHKTVEPTPDAAPQKSGWKLLKFLGIGK